jgi:glycosyltransferase involved in cell wall biosynthesis
MFLEFDGNMANDQFISILVLSYFRPEMTLELLRSIHSHADFPFEIILHDDHSDNPVQDRIYNEMKELCSTIIFGQGNVNMGFASSANRGTALCNSKYVLLLNNDCLMVNPCFQLVKQILDVPYVASVGPREVVQQQPGSLHGSRAIVSANNQAFTLSNLPNGAGVFAFKKDAWFDLGGFPQVYNNGGDIAFIFSLLRKGWFHAGFPISPEGNPAYRTFRNLDQENDCKNTTSHIRNFDQAYPRIFPFCNRQEWFYAQCEERRCRRYPLSQEQYLAERGHHNIDYWSKWADNSYDANGGINWEKLEDFGQSKWREQIDADIQRWKSLGA